MTRRNATYLRREQVAHLVRAAAGITNESTLALVGTGAVIAQLKAAPPELMTRRVALYAPGAPDIAAMSDLIERTIGEGTAFEGMFGYYARGVGQDTAILPYDWRLRARTVSLPRAPGITCICPDVVDVALAKLSAWREKDLGWLAAALRARLVTGAALRERARAINDPRAPAVAELDQRVASVETGVASGSRPVHRTDGSAPAPDTSGEDQDVGGPA